MHSLGSSMEPRSIKTFAAANNGQGPFSFCNKMNLSSFLYRIVFNLYDMIDDRFSFNVYLKKLVFNFSFSCNDDEGCQWSERRTLIVTGG
mmetsp:Transcript_8195/g.11913  ORF Transcript_8195/g.11913 Transcript_8195/m.11913 type:complete len:90 (-) Transcript_8195:13-282(-)